MILISSKMSFDRIELDFQSDEFDSTCERVSFKWKASIALPRKVISRGRVGRGGGGGEREVQDVR